LAEYGRTWQIAQKMASCLGNGKLLQVAANCLGNGKVAGDAL